MKRITLAAIVAALIVPLAVSCGKKKDLNAELEAVCKYIPDHGLKDGAAKYLTESYLNAYSEAFDAPTGAYGYIDGNEWLYYLVSGNGDAGAPVFKIENMDRTEPDRIDAIVSIAGDSEQHSAVFLLQDGKWRLDDWDNSKSLCREYVKTMRASYADGSIEQSLLADPETAPNAEQFRRELEAFYAKYGK